MQHFVFLVLVVHFMFAVPLFWSGDWMYYIRSIHFRVVTPISLLVPVDRWVGLTNICSNEEYLFHELVSDDEHERPVNFDLFWSWW